MRVPDPPVLRSIAPGKVGMAVTRVFTHVKLTYDDYARMPEGQRYELLEGDLQLTPAPTPWHQIISGNIEQGLMRFVEAEGLGFVLHAPLDVVLSDTTVVQPDIVFIATDRLGIIKEKNIQGAPDLVVEIISPTTRERDTITKRRLYSRFGVRELWLVDPDAGRVEVCGHTGTELVTRQVYERGTKVTSTVLPGLELEVNHVFRKPTDR